MNSALRHGTLSIWVAARMLVNFTLILGLGYTFALTAVGQTIFPDRADGSLLHNQDNEIVGSRLIGQGFLDADGAPLAQYFQSRPSAGDYDGAGSGGSNFGPENEEFISTLQARKTELSAFEGVPVAELPADALTASSSGLDPHISSAYALLQAERIAEQRGVSLAEVTSLVDEHTTAPDLGFLGNERVNVLELNTALDALTSTDQEN